MDIQNLYVNTLPEPIENKTHVFGFQWCDERYGFGEFAILFDDKGNIGMSTEHMCNDDDKEFAYELLKKLIDKAEVFD